MLGRGRTKREAPQTLLGVVLQGNILLLIGRDFYSTILKSHSV
jgi:hypothetical protein